MPDSLLAELEALSIQPNVATQAVRKAADADTEPTTRPLEEGSPPNNTDDDKIIESIEVDVADTSSAPGQPDASGLDENIADNDYDDNAAVEPWTPDVPTTPRPDPCPGGDDAGAYVSRTRAEMFLDLLESETDESEHSSPPRQLTSSPQSSGSGEAEGRSPTYSDWSGLSQHEAADSADPVLDQYLQATSNQGTAGGREFLRAQGKVYSQILKTFFSSECHCT